MYIKENIQERAQREGVSSHLVLKESLHVLILDYLFQKGVFSYLVFQGGTALRICYQGVRYSEDLDFVLKTKAKTFLKDLSKTLADLPGHLKRAAIFIVEASLKSQKETATFKRYVLSIKAEGMAALDKTHLEVAAVPSYENQSLLIRSEGMSLSPAVCVETPREILSDKLCAFGTRDYIKGRDLWDIYYLTHQLQVAMDERVREMALKKIRDYGAKKDDFVSNLSQRINILAKEGGRILKVEMDRFLPVAYRNVFQAKYPEISLEIGKTLSSFYDGIKK